jgi:Tol biopolymer transport system component
MPTLRSASLALVVVLAGAAGCDSKSKPAPGPKGVLIVPMLPTPGALMPQLFRVEAGRAPVQLTTPAADVVPTAANDFPVLSPDRRTIAFASGRDKPAEVNPMRRMLYLINADGTGAHRVTANPPDLCNEYPGDFSPDGTWIVFSMSCDESVHPMNHDLDRLYRIHPDGTGQEELLAAAPEMTDQNMDVPVFTPDGASILFVSGDPSGELWKYDVTPKRLTRLTRMADAGRSLRVRRPMVSPAGDVVYFSTMANDFSTGRMEALRLDGTGARQLFEFAIDPESLGFVEDRFALSPDGDAFVFRVLDGATGQDTLTRAGLDGKSRVSLPATSPFVGWGDPSWR